MHSKCNDAAIMKFLLVQAQGLPTDPNAAIDLILKINIDMPFFEKWPSSS